MKNYYLLAGLLCLLNCVFTFSASSKIYTWVDEDGKVHFSDQPVEDQDVSTITPETNNNISKPVSNNSQWQQDYNKTKQTKIEQEQKQSEQTAKKNKLCAQAKSEFAIFNQGGRIYIMSPEGKRDFQSDKQMAAKKAQLSKLIKKHC